METVVLKNITFSYRGTTKNALSNIDFKAVSGESVVVTGLTGAGKSTLLRCINRNVPASCRGEFSGEALVFGENTSGKNPAQLSKTVGMVFQDFESQLFSTSALMDAAFGAENLGLDTKEIRARATEAMKKVGLAGLEKRDPETLSGGQKQRLAIACVLAMDPDIICLDEPTTDLDPEGRSEVVNLIKELCKSGKAIVMAEHDAELILSANRADGLCLGKKIFSGQPEELLTDNDLSGHFGIRQPDTILLFDKLGIDKAPLNIEDAKKILLERGVPQDLSGSFDFKEPDKKTREKEGSALVKIEGLHHTYGKGDFEALSGVDLEIKRGEFIAVLGRNGSGKTTLVKHLNGLLRPSSGSVLMDGQDTAGLSISELGKKTGFVFQDPDHQIFASSVREEVAFAPYNHGFSKDDVVRETDKAIELVGLLDFADEDPFLLTKGMRQRVALASILSAGPEVIIMDEPTTGLDYPAQRAVMDILNELNKKGRTIIMITHSLWVAAEYARRVLVINNGKIIDDGPTRKVLSNQRILSGAGLCMPEITSLGMLFGVPVLNVEELTDILKKKVG
jgi:energy-coupling factor transport system ATP-binding protein